MFGSKPAFGSNTTFGSGNFGNTSSSFGQSTSAFGATKPLGTTFGTQPFGSTAQNSTMFGGSTGGTSSLFGSTATGTFGQPSASTNTGFGFSSQPSGTSLFGTTNQQTTNTGMFSNTSGSAFGAPKASFGFSSSMPGTGLFGQTQQQQQPQQTGLMFNTSSTSGTSLFGGSSTFGVGNTAGATGTTIKFQPLTGTDTMIKNGATTSINTRHMCITTMKEYESKSLEELRVEDYLANRKGPAQGSGMVVFGSGNQSSLFNSTPMPTGSTLFNANQNKMFGTNTNTTFGAPSNPVFGQQNTQNTSLFNKPLGFGTTTAPTNSTFSFGNTGTFGTANQQNKPLFGQTTLGSPSNNLFGGSTGAQPASGFNTSTAFGTTGFGTQAQNVSPFAAKPVGFGTSTTTTTPAFSFGSNPATSTGSFMFNKPATGFGNSFGTNTSFGGFNNTANTGSTLFGQNKPQLGFNTGFGTGLNTTGSSLFANTANKSGLGLSTGFGSGTNTGFGSSTGLGLGGMNFNFGGNNTALSSDQSLQLGNQQILQQQQQLLALVTSPYGDSPLFRDVVQDPAKKEEMLKPTNPEAQKALTSSVQYKVSSRPIIKLKPRPLLAFNNGKSSLFDGFGNDETSPSNDSFLPRRSVKKLFLKSRPSGTSLSGSLNESVQSIGESSWQPQSPEIEINSPSISSPLITPLNSKHKVHSSSKLSDVLKSSSDGISDRRTADLGSPSVDRVTRNANLDDTIPALNNLKVHRKLMPTSDDDDENCNNSSLINASEEDSRQETSKDSVEGEEPAVPHPAGVILRKSGYYTIPSLDELANMVDDDGNCFVENFTVGREGYGNIYFPGITNVANLNFDYIVHFRRKEVTVYPDDDLKPPLGQGLNKKAQITLDCVWPNDKSNHTPVKSPERLKLMNYQEKLERATARLAAKFIEYRPETGSWVFQVNHFSKYGLNDSDDDDDVPATLPPTQTSLPKELFLEQHLKTRTNGNAQMVNESVQTNNDSKLSTLTSLNQAEASSVPLRLRGMEEDDEMQDVMQGTFTNHVIEENENSESILPASHRLAKAVGASTQRVQSMKASFFWDESEDEEEMNERLYEQRQKGFSAAIPVVSGHLTVKVSHVERTLPQQSDSVVTSSSGLEESSRYLKFQHIQAEEHSLKSKFARLSAPLSKTCQPFIIPPTSEMLTKFILIEGSGVEPEKLPKVTTKKLLGLVPLSKSLISDKTHLIADAACALGRSFRVGWSSNFVFSHPGIVRTTNELNGRGTGDTIFKPFQITDSETDSFQKVYRPFSISLDSLSILPLCQSCDDVVMQNMELCLNAQLLLTKFGNEDGCPFAVPSAGVESIHQHATITAEILQNLSASHPDYDFIQRSKDVWDLMVALWGRLAEDLESADSGLYAHLMARREAFSDWLARTSKPVIDQEVERQKADNVMGKLYSVFSYLTGLQVKEAMVAAQENNDFRMSLLVSQAAGSIEVREMNKRQLDHWFQTKADKYISPDRLKIYALLSGTLVWSTSESVINTCEGLDWKRALALHLWYQNSPSASIADAVRDYDAAFKGQTSYGNYARPPNPSYLEDTSWGRISSSGDEDALELSNFDTCYHLLKLYADKSHRLDQLLTPSTYTSNPLDYRLSWILMQALKSVGFQHLSGLQDSSLHISFASQLATLGLWHWSIFVLLHINDVSRRKASILEFLGRHVSLKHNCSKEAFLLEKLGIPKEWIFKAKAIQAKRNNDVYSEAWYLLKCGQWNESHRLIIRHIAQDAIINEKYDNLKNMLEEMAVPEHSSVILDWVTGGRVFLDYIHLSQTVDRIVKGELDAYELEGLQPEVVSLCNRVGNLHCDSAKDRLCVSEMAKKAANLLRAVLSLGSGKTTIPSRLLAPHINKLPLPEDYGIQELRGLTQSYFLEMT